MYNNSLFEQKQIENYPPGKVFCMQVVGGGSLRHSRPGNPHRRTPEECWSPPMYLPTCETWHASTMEDCAEL